MGFDNSAPNSVIPIGSFSETAIEGVQITPGNYLDCSALSKVFHIISVALLFTRGL